MKYGIIILLTILTACSSSKTNNTLPFYNTPDFTPVWLGPDDAGYNAIHTISPFSLTNQLGETITDKQVKGHIYVANFFFASCGSICPRMMDNLNDVQQAFKNDDAVRMLSHSVTPGRDSVPALFKYAAIHHIDNHKWWLLTGNKDAIYTLARKAYFADDETGYNKTTNEFLHTENVLLIDKHGRIRGVYNGTIKLEMVNLINHIKLLEASGS
ncbi:SCO family protein [Mucilaginibacter boryungensis]|uniref:SCO family protein n=1 Tax=Mucilaginibacter boryungensis TaxID=768480 RepID=A0ABR9XCD9_9SPHI|nr:SCO family protein [Mucilaginibacter boryungensis]MBE9664845.1 SCO family protein [Mucilaginibacter boryungensis]